MKFNNSVPPSVKMTFNEVSDTEIHLNQSDFFMSSELTLKIRGQVHEVDSVIDCKKGANNQSLRLQLEMCCECCMGRALWISVDSLMRDANV